MSVILEQTSANNTTWSHNTNSSVRSLSVLETLFYSLIASGLILVTSLGNLMVLLAFYLEKRLRIVSNYFLLSLAFADSMIGFVSMPLFTMFLLIGYWPLPPFVCDLWLALDYTMSTASVGSLLVICVDRYLSITRPLTYRAHRTPRRVKLMIACVWCVAVIMWAPWIYLWPLWEGRKVKVNECYIQFLETNPLATLITALAAFYLPVIVITCLYAKVYLATERRSEELRQLQASHNQRRKLSERNEKGSKYLDLDENNSSSMATVSSKFTLLTTKCVHFGAKNEDIDRFNGRLLERCAGSFHRYSKRAAWVELDDSPLHQLSNYFQLLHSPESSSTSEPKLSTLLSDNSTDQPLSVTVDEVNLLQPSPLSCGSRRSTATISQLECTLHLLTLVNQSTREPPLPPLNSLSSPKSLQDLPTSSLYPFKTSITKDNLKDPQKVKTMTVGLQNGVQLSPGKKIPPKTPYQGNLSTMKTITARKKEEQRNETKAAKTLSAILLAFILTWTPYNLFVLINAFSDDIKGEKAISPVLYNISYWLCYINSTINPLLYALCNPTFRTTFKRILACDWRGSAARMQQEQAWRRGLYATAAVATLPTQRNVGP